jgi:hypothetical protein
MCLDFLLQCKISFKHNGLARLFENYSYVCLIGMYRSSSPPFLAVVSNVSSPLQFPNQHSCSQLIMFCKQFCPLRNLFQPFEAEEFTISRSTAECNPSLCD